MYTPDLVNHFQGIENFMAASKAMSRDSTFQVSLIRDLAEKHSVTPAQVMIRWAIQKQLIPICKNQIGRRMRENRSVTHFLLDNSEIALLDNLTTEEDRRERTELESMRKTSS